MRQLVRAGLIGAVSGLVVAAAATYLPLWVAGNGYEEHGDTLLALSILFIPIGALAAGAIAHLRGPTLHAGRLLLVVTAAVVVRGFAARRLRFPS